MQDEPRNDDERLERGSSPMAGTFDLHLDEVEADTEADEHGRSTLTSMRSGVAMMLVGALVLMVGMLSTTASGGGNATCPKGTVLVAKFNFSGKSYVFEKPAGNEKVVTITDANAQWGYWVSTTPISAVIVKGGPGSTTTTYEPAQTEGKFWNDDLPEVGSGNIPDISNLQFCGPKTPVTTTTTTKVTTTTAAPTTTTEATTTTTEGPTTTESPTTTEATTTTEAPTTTESPTTTEATTTTEAPTTTTEGPTTTEAPTTTTTTTEGPTTTESPTTTEETTTTIGSDVEGEVIVKTSVTPDDAAVSGDGVARALAFTGGSSLPLVVIGIVLLLSGATLALVTRSRQRQASA